jgi:hypothetical protein
MKSIWLILVLSLLAGCAADERPAPQGPLVPVTVFRDPSSSDSLFPMFFAVDGQPLGQLYAGDERTFEVQAGDHSFEYIMGVYNCASKVVLDAGETHLYRLARGCVIERVSDRGAAVASKPNEPGSPSATTWAAENRARQAVEDDAKADRFTIWQSSSVGNGR